MSPTPRQSTFDLDASRRYWKHAPSGLGKIDSEDLLRLDDAAFRDAWGSNARSRLTHYLEEDHFVRLYEREFHGRRVLSFGSGLGLIELRLLRAGVHVTCADIVASNLAVIERAARLEGVESRLRTITLEDPPSAAYGGPYDGVILWGSLMTMPADDQRRVLAALRGALAPSGRMELLLYTWRFVQDTVGNFSPERFARASDESVGSLHCPWSDWHDDEKLMELAGEELVMTRRQLWNQDQYITYTLERREDRPVAPAPGPLVSLLDAEETISDPVLRFDGAALDAMDGRLEPTGDGGVEVITGANRSHYAAGSPPWTLQEQELSGREHTIVLDATLTIGAFGVGILDLERDQFTFSRAISARGRVQHLLAVPVGDVPRHGRLILSNHQSVESSSRFVIHEMALRRRHPRD